MNPLVLPPCICSLYAVASVEPGCSATLVDCQAEQVSIVHVHMSMNDGMRIQEHAPGWKHKDR